MIPPEATQAGHSATAGDTPPAVSLHPLLILKTRSDFVKASNARRLNMAAFGLQARRRAADEAMPEAIRIGYTCSRKVGNSVARNRAKRRLREAARMVLPHSGHAGWDYVLIGRPHSTADRPFETLCADFRDALRKIHAPRAKR